VISLESCRI